MKTDLLYLTLPFAMIGFMVLILVASSSASSQGQIIEMTAKRFEYHPNHIVVKKSVPVTLEIHALDRVHGFQVPDLGIDTTVAPGKTTKVQFVPEKTGTFPFHCSVFCGDGHSDMVGEIVVQ